MSVSILLQQNPYGVLFAQGLIEVVDRYDKPFAIMHATHAIEQQLLYRRCFLALCSRKKLLLGCHERIWTFPVTSLVPAGLSYEDQAYDLAAQMGYEGCIIQKISIVPPQEEPYHLFAGIYLVHIPQGKVLHEELLAVDSDEFYGLQASQAATFDPLLQQTATQLFHECARRGSQ